MSGTALQCTSWPPSNQMPDGNARRRLTIPVVGQRQELSWHLPEVVLLHVITKRAETHAEKFGGFDLNAAGALERFREIPRVDPLDVRFEVKAGVREFDGGWISAVARRRSTANGRRKAFHQNRRCRLEGDGALQDVFELANVSRPVVPHQQLHGR